MYPGRHTTETRFDLGAMKMPLVRRFDRRS
jgi:hypothetical protein